MINFHTIAIFHEFFFQEYGLDKRGLGGNEAFYIVEQVISETLPLESKEKKLLDGFLAGRDRVQEEVEKEAEQGKMF